MSLMDVVVDRMAFGKKKNNPDVAAKLAEEKAKKIATLTQYGFERPQGGACAWVETPPEYQATSRQTAGLWPFCGAASAPLIGTPLGRNTINDQIVCGDPINLYLKGVISSPSAMILALNGRGKSTIAVRWALSLMDSGFLILVLGDLKPDFAGVIQENGGQVLTVAPGLHGINPLDGGPAWDLLDQLAPREQAKQRAEIHARRLNTLTGLVELALGKSLTEERNEGTVLSMAIGHAAEAAEAQGRQPLISDVQRVLRNAPSDIVDMLVFDPDMDEAARSRRYFELTETLQRGLNALGPEGPFGDVFCRPTSEPMRLDRSVSFDVSAVDESNGKQRAAIQLVCWAYGQAGASALKDLAKAGVVPERHHLMIMDELWQVLSAEERLVERVNALTKLNRTKGLGQVMITHSMKDLQLSTPRLTAMATGFLERSSLKVFGGLARNEMKDLTHVVPLSNREQDLLVALSAEGGVDPKTNKTLPPPGRGRFLLKLGDQTGSPFLMNLTEAEQRIHDTNEAWANAIAAARMDNGRDEVHP